MTQQITYKAYFSCSNCSSALIKGYNVRGSRVTHLFLPQVFMWIQDSVSCISFMLWLEEKDRDFQPQNIAIRWTRVKKKISFAAKWGVGTDEKHADSVKRAKLIIITLFPLISLCWKANRTCYFHTSEFVFTAATNNSCWWKRGQNKVTLKAFLLKELRKSYQGIKLG